MSDQIKGVASAGFRSGSTDSRTRERIFLLGDIGGTGARLAPPANGGTGLAVPYHAADFPGIAGAIRSFAAVDGMIEPERDASERMAAAASAKCPLNDPALIGLWGACREKC